MRREGSNFCHLFKAVLMVGVCTHGPDSHKALSEKGLGSGSHVPSKNAWPIIILPYSFVLIKVLIVRVFRF